VTGKARLPTVDSLLIGTARRLVPTECSEWWHSVVCVVVCVVVSVCSGGRQLVWQSEQVADVVCHRLLLWCLFTMELWCIYLHSSEMALCWSSNRNSFSCSNFNVNFSKETKNYRRLMLCRYRYWYRFLKMLLVFIFIKIYVCVYTIDVFCELLERILARFLCRGTMWVHYWLLLQMSLPWDEETRSDHISVVAAAMSYMHLSAAAETKKQFRSQTVPHQRLFSPSAFADFISCFGMFARKRQQFQLVTDKIHLLFISSAFVAFIS